jgi:hypothetical protein
MTDKVGYEMFIIKAIIWLLLLPFKILFFWVPKSDDSYDTDDEMLDTFDYMDMKEHNK